MGKPIPYQRVIPKSVTRQMPRGAKSQFWGTILLEETKISIGLHVFTYQKKGPTKRTPTTYYRTIDVFEKNRGAFSRINRLSSNSKSPWGHSDTKMKSRAYFAWLNPNDKQVPILIYDFFTNDSAFGSDYGDSCFLLFGAGWKGSIKDQYFGFADNDNGNLDHYHLSRTGTGELQVETSRSSAEGTTSQNHHWDRKTLMFQSEEEKFYSNFSE